MPRRCLKCRVWCCCVGVRIRLDQYCRVYFSLSAFLAVNVRNLAVLIVEIVPSAVKSVLLKFFFFCELAFGQSGKRMLLKHFGFILL